MTLSDLASLGNLVGGIAVLASLAYLALQVRQNTKHTRALIYTNRATRVEDFNLRMCHASDTTLDSCLAGGRADSNMNEAQLLRFYSFCRASFFDAQDTFRQHQEGLLSRDAYDGLVAIMKSRFSEPGMRAGWAVQRDTFSSEFRTFMDQMVRGAHNAPSAAMRMKSALASEIASSSER